MERNARSEFINLDRAEGDVYLSLLIVVSWIVRARAQHVCCTAEVCARARTRWETHLPGEIYGWLCDYVLTRAHAETREWNSPRYTFPAEFENRKPTLHPLPSLCLFENKILITIIMIDLPRVAHCTRAFFPPTPECVIAGMRTEIILFQHGTARHTFLRRRYVMKNRCYEQQTQLRLIRGNLFWW